MLHPILTLIRSRVGLQPSKFVGCNMTLCLDTSTWMFGILKCDVPRTEDWLKWSLSLTTKVAESLVFGFFLRCHMKKEYEIYEYEAIWNLRVPHWNYNRPSLYGCLYCQQCSGNAWCLFLEQMPGVQMCVNPYFADVKPLLQLADNLLRNFFENIY